MAPFGLTVFQLVTLPVILACLVTAIVSLLRTPRFRASGVAWLAVWVGAGITLLFPELTQRVARIMGIGRGADLVFYGAVLALMIGFFRVYVRLRWTEMVITTLVRHLAIQEALRGTPLPPPAAPPDDGNPS